MITRYFDKNGQELKVPINPAHLWTNNAKDNRPPDYVIIKQNEVEEMLTDPYGQSTMIRHLSEPVEEVYCRWQWDSGTWYHLICMVVRGNQVIIDRRPNGWSFYEEFQKHRPRFR